MKIPNGKPADSRGSGRQSAVAAAHGQAATRLNFATPGDSNVSGVAHPVDDKATGTLIEDQCDPEERTYRALMMLPKELLLVVGLHHKNELSFAQIAEVLETSEERARNMYARAKEMLYAAGGLPKLSHGEVSRAPVRSSASAAPARRSEG